MIDADSNGAALSQLAKIVSNARKVMTKIWITAKYDILFLKMFRQGDAGPLLAETRSDGPQKASLGE